MIVWWDELNGVEPKVASSGMDVAMLRSFNSLMHEKYDKKTKQVVRRDDAIGYSHTEGKDVVLRERHFRGGSASSWQDIQGIDRDEDLYLLAHGSGVTVGGLTATQLGNGLNQVLPAGYRGKIKLVSCNSATSASRDLRRRAANSGINVDYRAIFAKDLSRIVRGIKIQGMNGDALTKDGRIQVKKENGKYITGKAKKRTYRNGGRCLA